MVCRQRDELLASAGEERIGADEQRAGMKLDQGRKSGFDLTLSAGLKDMELDSLRASRLLHISNHPLDLRKVRIHEKGDHPGLGDPLAKLAPPPTRSAASAGS